MLYRNTPIHLVLSLAIGLSTAVMTAACSDDDPEGGGGQGGDTTSSTTSGTPSGEGGATSTSTSSGTPSGEGGGGAPSGEGGGGAPCSPPAGDPNCTSSAAAFEADVLPILTARCASCHGAPPLQSGGLDLRANNAHRELTESNASCGGKKLVVPGKPSESYLLNKVQNKQICGGDPMPPTGMMLSEADAKKINDWICAGALDN